MEKYHNNHNNMMNVKANEILSSVIRTNSLLLIKIVCKQYKLNFVCCSVKNYSSKTKLNMQKLIRNGLNNYCHKFSATAPLSGAIKLKQIMC